MSAQNDQTLGQINVQIDTVTGEPRQQKSTNQESHVTVRSFHPTTVGLAAGTNVYTVTATSDWELLWAHITYISDATVGQRQIRLGLLTPADVEIADFHTGQNQAASQTRHYVYMRGIQRETAFINNEVFVSLPQGFVIPTGYKFHIEDINNISVADSMTVTYQYL